MWDSNSQGSSSGGKAEIISMSCNVRLQPKAAFVDPKRELRALAKFIAKIEEPRRQVATQALCADARPEFRGFP